MGEITIFSTPNQSSPSILTITMDTSDTLIFKRILKDTLLAKSNEVENFLNEIETYYNFISLNYQDFKSFVKNKIISYSTCIKLRLFHRHVWGEGRNKSMDDL